VFECQKIVKKKMSIILIHPHVTENIIIEDRILTVIDEKITDKSCKILLQQSFVVWHTKLDDFTIPTYEFVICILYTRINKCVYLNIFYLFVRVYLSK